MTIRTYKSEDHNEIVALWSNCFGYQAAHNKPEDSIQRKTALNDSLFFVAVDDSTDKKVIGTVMAGWDGHRGWLYSLAVCENFRGRGIGTALIEHAVSVLRKLDCPKVNLQVMPGNEKVLSFYKKLGFEGEKRQSMGRKLY